MAVRKTNGKISARMGKKTAARPSRGAVDAPGKRHRQPTPNMKLDKRMGEPVGKQLGQKNFKMGSGRKRNTD